MSRYDTFKYSSDVAEEFYNANQTTEECLEQFYVNLDQFCRVRGVTYTKECKTSPNGDYIEFVFSPGVFHFTLNLDKNGEPSTVNFYAYAFRYIRDIRDSIWDTKTLFGLPVLAVMSNDEDFENYPRNFYASIISRSYVSSLVSAKRAEDDFNKSVNESLSKYGLSMEYLDMLINMYGK
jgi:hypothetical protein